MTTIYRHPNTLPRLVLGAAIFCACTPVWADAASQFQQWNNERWISRTINFTELGLSAPTVLNGTSAQQEFYLPVPNGIPLDGATMQLNGNYLRADGGRTSMTVSIDGYPVAARRMTDDQGVINQVIGVDGLPRTTGFVRLGLNWSSIISEAVCTDNRAPANSMRINTDSSFTYRYDRQAVKTLALAWSALPNAPVMLTGNTLSFAAYDTAWRTGLALQKNGKKPRIKALPVVGDKIDLSTTAVPADLKVIPAFNAISNGSTQYTIKDKAELGALIAMGSKGPLHADIMIGDAALLAQLRDATNALKDQVQANASTALTAYTAWMTQSFTVLDDKSGTGQLRLAKFGGTPVINVPSNIGDKADGLFQALWQPTAISQALTIDQASTPALNSDQVLLTRLGQFNAIAGTLDVLSRADRTIAFDLNAISADGRLPAKLVVDLSAAPNINGTPPVVSLFFNDFLLGAQRLTANGKPQRLSINIPSYVLAARNEIRISFLRQPTQEHCHDLPAAYPVSILPGSHLILAKSTLKPDFVGVAGTFSGKAELLVPEQWLTQPATSLPQVVNIANAAGFPAQKATLTVVKTNANAIAKPGSSFLALDVSFDKQSAASLHQGKLVINDNKDAPVFDVTGLDHLATAEVQKISGETGIVYRNIGQHAPVFNSAFRFTQGDVAVIGDQGVLLQFDKNDPSGAQIANTSNPQSMWERYMTVWIILIVLLALVFMAARIAHIRRNKNNQDKHSV